MDTKLKKSKQNNIKSQIKINKSKNKFKELKIISIASSLVFASCLVASLLISVFGLGFESQKAINSFKKEADKYFPKNVLVFNHNVLDYDDQTPTFEKYIKTEISFLLGEEIQYAYANDVLSTFDTRNNKDLLKYYNVNSEHFEDPVVNSSFNDAMSQFNVDWNSYFQRDEKTGKVSKLIKDIDMSDVTHKLIDFDIRMAKKYHPSALTTNGLTWLFSGGAKTLLGNYKNSDLYKEAIQDEKKISYDEYSANQSGGNVQFTLNIIPKSTFVNQSSGLFLSNNKSWFLNLQIYNLIMGIVPSAEFGAGINLNQQNSGLMYERSLEFINKHYAEILNSDGTIKIDWTTIEFKGTGKNNQEFLSPSDLHNPNFSNNFVLTKIGAVFLIIITPILLLGTVILNIIINPEISFKLKSKKKSISTDKSTESFDSEDK